MNVCLDRVHAASYNTNRIGGVMVRVLAEDIFMYFGIPRTHLQYVNINAA
jgi:hypothetical protein